MKKSKLLLVSLILGGGYIIYALSYFGGGLLGSTGDDQVIAGIASFLVAPHLLATGLAVLFNALGFFMIKKGFALTAGILYAVAGFLFIPYIFFVIIQSILSFIAYAKMGKLKEKHLKEVEVV